MHADFLLGAGCLGLGLGLGHFTALLNRTLAVTCLFLALAPLGYFLAVFFC